MPRFKSVCFFLLLVVLGRTAFAQSDQINKRTKIYTTCYSSDSMLLKGDNNLFIPVSVVITLTNENLKTDGPLQITAVIPPKTVGKVLAKMVPINRNLRFQCDFTWRTAPGDIGKTADLTYVYAFPFTDGQYHAVSQGPNGEITHKNMFAYDFPVPVGTPVCAARDGVIAFIKSDSRKGGLDQSFIDDANYISVYHDDGTMANYYHLEKDGVRVKEGDTVIKGQIIGYSGNTGFTSGPHLHFEVTAPDLSADVKKWLAFKWELPEDATLTATTASLEPEDAK